MRGIIAAIIRAMRQVAQTALDQILNLTRNLIAFPLHVFGPGGPQRLPTQRPVFEAPVSTTDLGGELQTAPRGATARNREGDGVKAVLEFAALSDKERATYDLSPVRRADVQALLLRMTQDQLTTLASRGSSAVRNLLLTGNAKVSGVPSVSTAKAIESEKQSVDDLLARNLEALKKRLLKPESSSQSYTAPGM